MEHFGFIFASYLVTILIIAIVAIWLYWDHSTQKKALLALEARGVRRRSSSNSRQATTKLDSNNAARDAGQ